MIKKFQESYNKIIPVLGIIAGGLLLPTLFGFIDDSFNETTFIMLIQYGLMLVANILLVKFSYSKNKNIVAPAILFLSGYAIAQLCNFIANGSIPALVYFVLYVAGIILLCMAKKALKLLYVVLLLIIAFFVASVFSGSVIGLSALLSTLCFISLIYLENDNVEEKGEIRE